MNHERGSYHFFLYIFLNLQKKNVGRELPYDCLQSYVRNVHVLPTEDTERGLMCG